MQQSKLPNVGTTIFSVMSALAQEHGAINLAQGFPNFNPDERLMSLIDKHVRGGMNQYSPMPGVPALLKRIGEMVGNLYGCPVDPLAEVTVTTGAVQGLYTAITTFVHPGEEVILFEPAYDSYLPAIQLTGGVAVPIKGVAPYFKPDWEAVARAINPRTRMIILNTPHNPTGTNWTKEDMESLSALVRGTDILVLSDEVYEHLVFDGKRHESVLRYPELWGRCIAAFSFGKTFHITGWRVGYVVGAAPLMKEFRKAHQYFTFCVNAPAQYALADYMEDASTYLSLPAFYQAKRDLFREQLTNTGFELLPCEGTFFQLARYSALSDEPDMEFAKRLTIEKGVAVIPLSPFYGDGTDEKIIRFCFAKTDETLIAAGKKLIIDN